MSLLRTIGWNGYGTVRRSACAARAAFNASASTVGSRSACVTTHRSRTLVDRPSRSAHDDGRPSHAAQREPCCDDHHAHRGCGSARRIPGPPCGYLDGDAGCDHAGWTGCCNPHRCGDRAQRTLALARPHERDRRARSCRATITGCSAATAPAGDAS